MPIAIIDYGAGNLRSVEKALEKLGFQAVITSDIKEIDGAEGMVLPGVGAFDPAIKELRKKELTDAIVSGIKKNKPFLGLCLGMQLLFDKSEEGREKGLGLIKGAVKKFSFPGPYSLVPSPLLKIPHMGWNNIRIKKSSPLFEGIRGSAKMYFVHSYYCVPDDRSDILTTTDYGVKFASSVSRGNIFALQFHPEKSGDTGLKILKNFGELCK